MEKDLKIEREQLFTGVRYQWGGKKVISSHSSIQLDFLVATKPPAGQWEKKSGLKYFTDSEALSTKYIL